MWVRSPESPSAAVLMFAYAVWFANSALAQGPPSSASTLETEVKDIGTENGALLEQLRQLKEQQDTLLRLVGSYSAGSTESPPLRMKLTTYMNVHGFPMKLQLS